MKPHELAQEVVETESQQFKKLKLSYDKKWYMTLRHELGFIILK